MLAVLLSALPKDNTSDLVGFVFTYISYVEQEAVSLDPESNSGSTTSEVNALTIEQKSVINVILEIPI